MKASGAGLVLRALEEEGVRFAFGIPGTHNIELYDALSQSAQITPILVTDEQSASFMADGVSRSSGSLGVVNVVPGAGVTHAMSGIAEAFMDCVPVLVLTCGIRNDTGRAYQLHDIDQLALLRPITKATFKIESPSEIYSTMRRACGLAREGCPGPVAVEIPANYYLVRQDIEPPVFAPADRRSPRPDSASITRAAEMLRAARRPILYVGYGAHHACESLLELAERLGSPVATTIQGKGVFPETHPLFLWNGLGASTPPFVRKIETECDCMLAIGCRFSEVATASYGFKPPAALIHIDVDARVFNRNYRAALTIESDAGEAIEALLGEIPAARPPAQETIARGHEHVRERWAEHAGEQRVTPAALFAALQQIMDRGAIYATDSGNGTFLAMEHLRLERPGRFLAPVDFSCMGYAVPAAIGAKLANPRTDVVALAGDGAFLMTGLEMASAAAYGAGLIVIALRDGELAQIAQFQRTTLDRATCSELHPYNLKSLAAATNCAYLSLHRDAEAQEVLREALEISHAGKPVVVEAAIDYSSKTYFTRGVVTTNFWRLPWSDRVRLLARAIGRKVLS